MLSYTADTDQLATYQSIQLLEAGTAYIPPRGVSSQCDIGLSRVSIVLAWFKDIMTISDVRVLDTRFM